MLIGTRTALRLMLAPAALLVATATLAAAQPDLLIRLDGPAQAEAGADISEQVTVTVHNAGSATASGTLGGGAGFMIDLFLSRTQIPAGFAVFSANYSDGVLLRGGRVSNTRNLLAGQAIAYPIGGTIPTDTPAGTYRLCASVDPGGRVTEANEGNNLDCRTLRITRSGHALVGQYVPTSTPPILLPAPPSQPARPPDLPTSGCQQVGRNVRDDGVVEFYYADGSIVRHFPGGRIERVAPDGKLSVLEPLNSPTPTLPQLSSGLAGWGQGLSTSLLSVIENYFTAAQMQSYLTSESGLTFYQKIDKRLRVISVLTRETVK